METLPFSEVRQVFKVFPQRLEGGGWSVPFATLYRTRGEESFEIFYWAYFESSECARIYATRKNRELILGSGSDQAGHSLALPSIADARDKVIRRFSDKFSHAVKNVVTEQHNALLKSALEKVDLSKLL